MYGFGLGEEDCDFEVISPNNGSADECPTNLQIVTANTFSHHVLPSLPLTTLPRLCARVLFSQFRQDVWSNSFDDTREYGISSVEEPSLNVCRIVEVDAAFENGVLCDSKVSSDWWHSRYGS